MQMPFNKPHVGGKELWYKAQAHGRGQLAGHSRPGPSRIDARGRGLVGAPGQNAGIGVAVWLVRAVRWHLMMEGLAGC